MTLKEAIEKVGVGGKVTRDGNFVLEVLYIGNRVALLRHTVDPFNECSADLNNHNYVPYSEPKKRVVLQAWRYLARTGVTSVQFFEVSNEHQAEAIMASGQIRAYDIPDLVFEDGKQVFDADA